LPTEAEWEFAARGGNKNQGFIYSGSNNLNEVCWFSGNSDWETKPVGQKLPNELGIYDMSGNIWEWTNDWYENFGTASVTDPTGPNTGSGRVGRGGGWRYGAESCRVADRGNIDPWFSWGGSGGFRVVFAHN
jgi:formylglycine-generating enzyme required for sulfatase activity